MQQLAREKLTGKILKKVFCDRCGKKTQVIPFQAKGEQIKLCGKCILELLVSFYKVYWSEE